MEIRNRKVIFTVTEKGRLGAPVSHTSSKELHTKIRNSPYETVVYDKRGNPTGKYFTPQNHFKAPNDYKPRLEKECSRSTTIDEIAVNHFISNESSPYFIDAKKWSKLTEQVRLEVHLTLNAEGKEFKYELI